MKFIVLFFISFLYFFSHAQFEKSVKFKRIGEDEGLSSNWVRVIHQDKLGFIWMGTTDGVNRYDAYECKTFRPNINKQNLKLGGVSVGDIANKGENGDLWIASNGGIFIYSNNQLKRAPNLPAGSFNKIVKETEDVLWLLENKNTYRVDLKKNEVLNFSRDESSPFFNKLIFSGFKDNKGNIWFGGLAEVYKYEISSQKITTYTEFVGLDRSTKNDILDIVEDHSGNIWVGFGQNGLFKSDFKNGKSSFVKHSDGIVIDLLVDKDNYLWIANATNLGLRCIDLNTNKEVTFKYDISDPNSISDSSVFCLFEDDVNDIWVGTFGAGVNFFSKRSKKIHVLNQGKGKYHLKNDLIKNIVEDNTYYWVGTEGGLDRVSKKDFSVKHYSYEPNNPNSLLRDAIQKLLIDSNEDLWVGMWDGGLCKYNRQKDNFIRYKPSDIRDGLENINVMSLFEDSENRLWLGTHGDIGLYFLEKRTNKFTAITDILPSTKASLVKNISQISGYKKNKMVFCTYHSIIIFDYKTFKIKEYNLGGMLGFSAGVSCSFVDSKGVIWIGSNVGLFKFNEEKEELTKPETDIPILNFSVKGIIEDDQNNIWVSSNVGIFRFHQKDGVVKRFTKKDGLSTNDFNRNSILKAKNGNLMFGSSKGVNYFNPSKFKLNKKPPKLAITSFGILKSTPNEDKKYEYVIEDLNPSQKIVLENDQSSIVISFTGLNYLNPEKNEFKYKLEGYDKVWVNSDNKRTATYTNLQEGEYTFKVKGTNNDGLVSKDYKAIEIIKKGPWYNSRWFKTLMSLFLISLPISFYFIRVSILKKQGKVLSEKVEERTKELKGVNEELEKKSDKILQQNAELFQHRNNLEELVSKRTIELRKAKLKAEESDKLKTAFIANMSHEIRTPMNAIYGFSGLLGDEDVNKEEQNEYIDIIKENCETLLVLIDDILDISILETEGVQLNFQEINIDDFLKHVELMFRSKIRDGIKLRFIQTTDESNESIISTDPIRLRQILSNIINNSIKFTETGFIDFGYAKTDDNITFYVKDTGVGIAKKDLKEIFKPFIKAGNTDQKIYRGTGIGLSISKSIVKSFDGDIWVESTLNKGSTFYIKLPL